MASTPKTPLYRRPGAITFLYLVFSICWIISTDRIMHSFALPDVFLETLSIAKGAF